MSGWLVERGPTYGARARIVAVPFAGSGASALLPWAPLLPPDLALSVVRLPGRENRFRERHLTEMDEVVEQLLPHVLGDPLVPTVVFGYSLGALIAYELAVRLQAAGSPPLLLAVGGAQAPQLGPTTPPIAALGDAAFVAAVRDLGGTPAEVFEHPELLAMVLPTLRADFALVDGYRYAERPLLATPITTYSGEHDRELTRVGIERWGELTGAGCTHHTFDGGHFFLSVDPGPLVTRLVADIRACLGGRQV